MITWTDVDSSQIVRIGYDEEKLEAQVQFKDRRTGDVSSTYLYRGVPKEVVDGIISADSVGRQFAATLKFGYEYQKL